ncbi:T3SS effector HopA1 family protein [Amycolatopsis sp.]|uniref:T3SS effector HopA1 family protein n=1 Tax=Amycolatopsis sp. TaxID=37632 RepID=UPI002F4117AE
MLDTLRTVEVDHRENRAVVGGRLLRAADPAALRARLATALYDHLHAGESESEAELPGFRDRLAAAVPHRLTRMRGRVRSADVVEVDGVRVRVPAGAAAVGARTTFDIDCRRPHLAPGFFLVDGSPGHGLTSGDHTLRLYLHLVAPDTATAAWHEVLVLLEDLGVPYRAKVGLHLPRRDALVLYLGRDAWPAAPEIVKGLSGIRGLGAAVSAYAHRVADGVAAAWDPADSRPGHRGLSFGEHRSRVIADALLAPGVREDELARSFAAGNVDAARIFRNTTSPNL